MRGIFALTTAPDLLNKLRHEYAQLQRRPTDTYTAFNFFVTAEHLLDWLYPGKANETRRKQARASNVLLQICSHVANGAKHFEVEAKHHQSVTDTGRSRGLFSTRMFAARLFAGRLFPKGGLYVRLMGDAEQLLGQSISALDLSRRVLDYWEQNPDLQDVAKRAEPSAAADLASDVGSSDS